MNHAISNSGSLEAAYYRLQDLAHDEDLKRERLDAICERIRDAFDAKDVMSAFDVVSAGDPDRMQGLYEALAILPQLQTWTIEDARLRNIAIAFERVSSYYAGYMAAKELGA